MEAVHKQIATGEATRRKGFALLCSSFEIPARSTTTTRALSTS